MMRWFIYLTLVLASCIPATAQQLNELRSAYKSATRSQQDAEAFYEMVSGVTKSDIPVLQAYKGSGLMLLARYEKLAARKPKVKEAVQWIEAAVAADPDNAEIRLIRLSVQEHLPKLLRYNQHIEEDRQFIQQALPSIKDEGLKAMINGYFAEFSKD